MKKILTKDAKVAVNALCRQSCECMHTIADLMEAVVAAKDMCNEGKFKSARSPECCDNMMKELVYMLKCEANCGIAEAGIVAVGGEIEVLDYSDEDADTPHA